MNIVDWFDVHNKEHLLAYQHLIQKGYWPVGFNTDDLQFSPIWQMELASKLAREYVSKELAQSGE